MGSGYDAPVGRCLSNAGRTASFAIILGIYAVAGAAGVAVASIIKVPTLGEGDLVPLAKAAVADLVATVVVWLAGIAVNNTSTYDPYWSVYTPLAYCFFVLEEVNLKERDVPLARVILLGVSCWVWAIRLTLNWARDFTGVNHEDFRYVSLRNESFRAKGHPKALYWILGSFCALMLVPTILVYLGTVPVFFALSKGVEDDGASPFNPLDIIACCVSVGAALIQFVADEQMRRFRKSEHAAGTVMETGLWRYSRHPNYFGEIMFWFGLYLHALAADAASFWFTGAGFLAMLLLMLFASIPMMEKRSLQRRPEYARTIETTSRLVPWFRFRARGVTRVESASTE
mmetsp:Transcript_11911/g.33692  ORF Transcript_11911/g.33692 Transcript_11911/m.33692 type:complete len:343 (+) Transcript_11911:157-1185(+)